MFVRVFLALAAWLSLSSLLQAQSKPNWEAFNDYSSSALTSPNATGYKLRTAGDYGPLRNFETADDLSVTVAVENEGGTPDDFGARGGALNAGSPALKLFGGKVDLANDGLPGVRALVKLTLVFSGLDPTKVYKFCGTAARGGNYPNRWAVFSIVGVGNFVAAHQDGSDNKNIITLASFPASAGSLEVNQVALNTGQNKVGSLVCWDKIEPSAEGTIRIEALRYLGRTPFGNAADTGTSYAYGFEAMYLAEYDATGDLRITDNPVSQKVPAGTKATLAVGATSSRPITYQWQKAAAGVANFTDIPGASLASYTTPTLVVADDETRFRCNLTSGPDHASSGEAIINVDGIIPTVTGATGSINFNSVYVTFSEPMKLDQLADAGNYGLSGSLTIMIKSAVALDTTTARLLTSEQEPGTKYTVTVSGIEDIAGNKIADSKRDFTGFTIVKGVVGLEIWKNIGGGAVNDLRSHARYPLDPDLDLVTTALDSLLAIPAVPDNNTYGGRFRAWITPPETGEYEFFVRADDSGELRLNTVDDSFAEIDDPNLNTPIAVDSTAGDTFQESGVDGSTSVPIALEAGTKYAIQAIWKESNGNDYLQVAWRLVGDPTPAAELLPIPSEFFCYYGPADLPKVTKVSFEGGKVIIEWSGAGLQSSQDFKTWKDEVGAASPFSVTPVGHAFYRAKN